jgi:hypothetical protein
MRAAPTQFTINVSECPETVTGANVKFDGTSDNNDQSLLALDSGRASPPGLGSRSQIKTARPSHCTPLHPTTPSQKAQTRSTLSPAMSPQARRSPPVQQTVPLSSPSFTNNAVPSRAHSPPPDHAPPHNRERFAGMRIFRPEITR